MEPSPSDHRSDKTSLGSPAARPAGQPQVDFSEWVRATSDPADLRLHEAGFTYADLFSPERLAELTARFDAFFGAADPEGHARFAAYRACKGDGMKHEA